MLAWIEERHGLACDAINDRLLVRLAAVAVKAGQSQILQ